MCQYVYPLKKASDSVSVSMCFQSSKKVTHGKQHMTKARCCSRVGQDDWPTVVCKEVALRSYFSQWLENRRLCSLMVFVRLLQANRKAGDTEKAIIITTVFLLPAGRPGLQRPIPVHKSEHSGVCLKIQYLGERSVDPLGHWPVCLASHKF